MAEENNTEPVKVKRRLRAPETMRERTQKLQNEKAKSESGSRNPFRAFWRGFTFPIRWVFRQIARFGRFLGKFKVFRVIGLILVPRYFRDSWKELKLVTWPNARQSVRLTYAVLVFSIIFGVVIAVIDFGLDKLFKAFVLN